MTEAKGNFADILQSWLTGPGRLTADCIILDTPAPNCVKSMTTKFEKRFFRWDRARVQSEAGTQGLLI